MKALSWVAFLLGLSAITVLVAWRGVEEVAGTIAVAGWGIPLLAIFYLPRVALQGAAWRLLFAPGREPGYGAAIRGIWIGQSVNGMLPVATIGGEVVKARLMMQWGVRGAAAGASVVVDKTVQAVNVLMQALVGIGVLVWLGADGPLIGGALAVFAILAAGIAGFFLVQRAGTFGFLAGVGAKLVKTEYLARLSGGASALDAAIRDIYAAPRRVVLACAIRFLGTLVIAGEVWLAAALMGHPIGIVEAVMLKTLTSALRGAAFAVPAGLGLQEGGFIVLGSVLGLSPELMLAISLATRVRELMVGVPGLIAWQHAEGRAFLRRRASPDDAGGSQS